MSADIAELTTRLQRRDISLWPEDNVAPNRLGWLDIHESMREHVDTITSWAKTIDAKHIVLLGMGGSSLGPEVLRACAGNDRLIVLDTTDPQTIANVPIEDAFFLVSSKSGSTLEIRTLFAYFWEKVSDGNRFAAITDPHTELAALASEHHFARTWSNPPDIGGRYSVLSYFGLVPAALIGYDLTKLLATCDAVDIADAVSLGVAMGEHARSGQDKITIKTTPEYASFGLWVEQLIAESTGKSGIGCVPVPTIDSETGDDRFAINVALASPNDLGGEFYKWELATAIAGHVLNIDPFNEPNVTESKQNTLAVLDALPLPETTDALPASEVFAWLKETTQPGDYVSLQAYFPYGDNEALASLRTRTRDALGGIAVTAGFGPRFLHSTGQLHKGGPNTCVAVQIVPATPTADLAIPGYPYDFNTLIRAQAEGDFRSLRDHGRRVIRVVTDDLGDVR